jgi:hypothetical protein
MVATERLSRVTGWAEASGQKSAIGGRATLQAVTRVKLEQASKVKSWMPTHQVLGEGRADREENRHAPVRSTGVMSTACKESGLSHWGISGAGGGRASNILYRRMASPEVGEGHTTEEAG